MAVAPSIIINLPGIPIDNLPSAGTVGILRAMQSDGLLNGQNIAVDGGAAVGDGGGGLYAWSTLSTLDDDGNSVIRPNDVAPLEAGRWILTGTAATAGALANLAAPGGSALIGTPTGTVASDLAARPTFTQLADETGAALIGTTDGVTVQQSLDQNLQLLTSVALIQGYYPGASLYVPQGATAVASFTGGTGGTNGTFALAFSGGNFGANPAGTFTVVGGTITAITLTGPGLYIGASPTAPTASFAASAGLTGASLVLTIGYLVGAGKYYYTDTANPHQVALMQNQANAAVIIDANVDFLDSAYIEGLAEDAEESVDLAAAQVTLAGTIVGSVIRNNLLSLEDGIASPQALYYTSTAGRYRLTASGMAICAANEERLCYDTSGHFLGSMFQPADTYYSAPWHDAAAPHTSGDPAYLLATTGTGTIAYAGAHSELDLFGTTGKGVVLTQGNTPTQYFQATNCKVTPAINDVLRIHGFVSMTVGLAGSMTIRCRGNNFQLNFNYDAAGVITGFTESWANQRAGFFDMGVINGKRWTYLWFDNQASSTTDTYPAIGFNTADVGAKLHFCDLMIQKNPTSAPAAWPVCAAAKTFAADSIHTGITQNVGYIMPYAAQARSQAPGGVITAPALTVGLPYWAIEKQIRVVHSTETADRSGIMHNSQEIYAFTPWRVTGTGPWTVGAGPSSFPNTYVPVANKGATTYTIQPVFMNRPELAPMIKRLETAQLYIGTIVTDGCMFISQTDKATSYWQQTDIRSNQTAMQYLSGSTGVYARNCLVMGCPLTHTRAAYQVQEDDTDEMRTFVGEFSMQIGAGPAVVDGTRFERIARGPFPSGVLTSSAVSFSANNTYYDLVWSDHIYPTRGVFANPTCNYLFLGRFTAKDQMYWQSQKEVEVDLLDGNGFRTLTAAGVSETSLPVGLRASHYGTYDFTSNTLTEDPDPTLSMMIRRFTFSTGTIQNKPGFGFHADQVRKDGQSYTKYPALGSVWVISSATMRVRVYVQGGYWLSNVYTPNLTGNPAQTASGTHADNFQTNANQISWTGMVSNNVVILNNGQGPFLTGYSGAAIGTINLTNWVICTSEINGSLLGNGGSATPSIINLVNVTLIQRAAPLRFVDGSAEVTRFSSSGSLTTINLTNVHAITAHPTGANWGGATVNGTVQLIPAPAISAFGTVTPAATRPALNNIIPYELLDLDVGTVSANANPRDFYVTAYGEQRLSMPVNSIWQSCIGNHPRWDDVVAEVVRVYHKAPEIRLTIPAATTVGTVFSLAGAVKASSFHPTHGNHRGGFFTLDGLGGLVVAKALTGIDDLRLLRTALDEIILVDITP